VGVEEVLGALSVAREHLGRAGKGGHRVDLQVIGDTADQILLVE
jgi:hypothetical protein